MRELTKELKLELQSYNQGQLNNAFIGACKDGDLEIVRYLLTSPELKDHADIHAYEDSGFRWACHNGLLEVVRYLLTSPELKEHADIHANNDYGFRFACQKGHLDVVRYLLTSPELKEHAYIHAIRDEGFYSACQNGHFDIVQYLLTLSGQYYINFQKTMHNLEWAISYSYFDIVKAMTLSLYKNDMMAYLENLPKIEQYCLDNGLNFVEWQEEMVKEDININSHTTELFV